MRPDHMHKTGLMRRCVRPYMRSFLPSKLYTRNPPTRQSFLRPASIRPKTSSTIHDHFSSLPQPYTPPPVIQRAVSSLLNDAFKNGTFSWDYTIASCLSVLLFSLVHEKVGSGRNGVAQRLSSKMTYQSVNLQLEKGRLLAAFDFSNTRWVILYDIVPVHL